MSQFGQYLYITPFQVGQWLSVIDLEHLVPSFLERRVTGPQLLQLDSRQLRQLGCDADDKAKVG